MIDILLCMIEGLWKTLNLTILYNRYTLFVYYWLKNKIFKYYDDTDLNIFKSGMLNKLLLKYT